MERMPLVEYDPMVHEGSWQGWGESLLLYEAEGQIIVAVYSCCNLGCKIGDNVFRKEWRLDRIEVRLSSFEAYAPACSRDDLNTCLKGVEPPHPALL
jgi:hypothetical protein